MSHIPGTSPKTANFIREHKVCSDDYAIGKSCRRGSMAAVLSAKQKFSNKNYKIKIYDRSREADFKHELQMFLTPADHKNLMKPLHWCEIFYSGFHCMYVL